MFLDRVGLYGSGHAVVTRAEKTADGNYTVIKSWSQQTSVVTGDVAQPDPGPRGSRAYTSGAHPVRADPRPPTTAEARPAKTGEPGGPDLSRCHTADLHADFVEGAWPKEVPAAAVWCPHGRRPSPAMPP
ncbi:hypothetical protein Sviol_44630 [Streptomyces violascens]|uniref:Uncharacterized protein n=1 Tax=Streptomyces violascens TaxID=67381 RepID=A0ABQ3QRY0_9ACTN|nr:hypothetical protein Sviol_44630 [Streptomyces violascens]